MKWYGHDRAWDELRHAVSVGKLHHGWILGGPRGIGKAAFATNAAHWLLDHGEPAKTAALIAAGSHPDFRVLQRLPKDTVKDTDEPVAEGDLKRNISVKQIRELGPLLSSRPSIAPRRIILIDSIDDLDREGANALLKNLEEPPEGTIFFAVSHAPGRLLPTIRSRCQTLRFDPLSDADMADAIEQAIPDIDDRERATLIRAGGGSPGQALSFAGLQLAELEQTMMRIVQQGDRDNRLRGELSRKLSLKAAHPRYEAFLRRVPSFIAEHGIEAGLDRMPVHLAGWEAAVALSGKALPLNVDKQAVILELGRILATLSQEAADVRV